MKKIVYKSRAIEAVIVITAVCLLLSLWPLRLWHEQVTSAQSPVQGTMTGVINEEKTVLQTITAQYDHMDTIRVYLGEGSTQGSFYLRILDEQWQMVCEERVAVDTANLPGYQEAVIDIDMVVGSSYHVILQGIDAEIYAGCEAYSPEEMPYFVTMYYNDGALEGRCLVAEYHYGVPLRKGRVLLYGALILAAAALLIFLVRMYYRKREDKLITVERAFKYTMNPLTAVGTAAGLSLVLCGVFGNYLLDNTVFFVSILFLSAILFYGINHGRQGQEDILTLEYIRNHGADLFQSVCIAGAIAGCCEYMSGLYDIHHSVAERREMLWFALAVIAMFKWKEIFNLYNAVYVVAAGLYGYHYYRTNLTPEMDELHVRVLKYTVWIAVLLGLILIRTLIGLFRRRLARPSLFAGLLGVFFVLIILFRNGRWWSVALAVSFTLFYLNYGMWEHRERILVNLVRGVVFQFLAATGYALLHRPYVTFRNARYTHIFHTVTITAAYLTMVECVAGVLFLAKFAKSRKLRDFWKELVFFGAVSSYMIFTMARTGYFAVGITLCFALVIMAAGRGKEKIRNAGRSFLWLALSVAVCLPVTFTLQRNVPAAVSDPFLYEIEYSMYCPQDVMRGRNLDSKNFMRVGRFIDVFAEKIFGIPEGTFDVYGEIEQYQSTHKEKREQTEKEKAILMEEMEAAGQEIPQEVPKQEDYTNGRTDIFRSYIEQLNWTGHEEMGAVLQNGEIATHAHNIYLQAAYDHGIFVGIVFVLVGISAFVKGCLYYCRKRDKITYAALPVVVTAAVGVAGMVEWVFHLSNPCGLFLMLVITPLLFQEESLGHE